LADFFQEFAGNHFGDLATVLGRHIKNRNEKIRINDNYSYKETYSSNMEDGDVIKIRTQG
jgi:hypothetical protein